MTPFLTRFGLREDGSVMDDSPRARAARATLCPRPGGPAVSRDAAPNTFAGGRE
jgi:hypothetical protein